MKNDLTRFEKDLLIAINFSNNKKYTHKNLMEWSSSKSRIENNLKEGEKIYHALGTYIAIKENENGK